MKGVYISIQLFITFITFIIIIMIGACLIHRCAIHPTSKGVGFPHNVCNDIYTNLQLKKQ